MARPIIPEFNEPEKYAESAPDTGTVFGAALELGQSYTLVRQQQKRNILADFQKQGDKVEPEVLRAEFGVEFDKPMTRLAAQFVKDDIDEKQKLQAIVDAADGWFSGNVAPIAGTLVGAMSDPIEFGIGAVLGVGAGAAAKAMNVGKAGKLAINMIDNSMAASLSEVAAFKAAQEGNFEEYTAEQAVKNVMIGGIGFTAAMHGIGAVASKLSKLGTKHADVQYRTTDGMVQANKSSDFANMIDEEITKDIRLDDNIKTAVTESLGERGADILAKSEDLIDVGNEVRKRMASGEITTKEGEAFLDSLVENGVEKRRLGYLDENPEVNMSDDFRKRAKDFAESRESDIDFSPEGKKILDETPEEIKIDDYDELVIEQANATRQRFAADEVATKELKEIDDFKAREIERIDAVENYANCLMAGAL